MAKPKKNKRRITINDIEYFWWFDSFGALLIEWVGAPSNSCNVLETGVLHFWQEFEIKAYIERDGCLMSAESGHELSMIKPKEVRHIVLYALKKGWQPTILTTRKPFIPFPQIPKEEFFKLATS